MTRLAVAVDAVVAAVSEERLWARHMAMAEFGATLLGGVNRQALSDEDIAARHQMVAWARSREFALATDPIGNLFICRHGADDAAAPVMSGSHLDSQPTGGKFDGAYGVLAAFEALEAMADAGVETARAVEAVAWTNEEGSRFAPGMMGSAVFCGARDIDEMRAVADIEGVRLDTALDAFLAATPEIAERALMTPPAAYVEAHIEQGPRLEASGNTIGVVSGIQGLSWFEVTMSGDEAHAGTTPRAARHDALLAAVDAIHVLADELADAEDAIRFTVGRMVVGPGSPNTVPGQVTFTIDLRHPSADIVAACTARIEVVCQAAAAERRCAAAIRPLISVPPTAFAPAVVDTVRQNAATLALAHMDIVSGAGHDAMHMAMLCPTGMVFVPCEKGISHNELESATPHDLAAGARVLAASLVELANRKQS